VTVFIPVTFNDCSPGEAIYKIVIMKITKNIGMLLLAVLL